MLSVDRELQDGRAGWRRDRDPEAVKADRTGQRLFILPQDCPFLVARLRRLSVFADKLVVANIQKFERPGVGPVRELPGNFPERKRCAAD
ncbi:MAG: hypothetical protein ACK55I_19235 [bacterium]